MMSIRTLFLVLLCSTIFLPSTQNTAQAQNGLRLFARGASGGPLQDGTKVRVFPIEYSSIGHKSVDLVNLPKGVGIRDSILANGYTNRMYETTDKSGTHYFVYALTPNDDVFISFAERSRDNKPRIAEIKEAIGRIVYMKSLETIPGVTAEFFNDVRQSIFGAPPADFESEVDPTASMTAAEYIASQRVSTAPDVRETKHLNLIFRDRVPMATGTDVRVVSMRLGNRNSHAMRADQLLVNRGASDQVSENGYTANSYPVTTNENLLHYLVFAADANGVVHVSSANNTRRPVFDQLVSGDMWMKRLTEIEGMNQAIFDQIRFEQFGLANIPFQSEIPTSTPPADPPVVEDPPVAEDPDGGDSAEELPPVAVNPPVNDPPPSTDPPPVTSPVNLTLIGPDGPLAAGTQVFVYQKTYDTVGPKRVELTDLPKEKGDLDELGAGGATQLTYERTTDANKTHYLVYAAETDGAVYVSTSSGVVVHDQVKSGEMTMLPLENMGDVPTGLVLDIQRGLLGQLPLIVVNAENGSPFPPETELRVLMRDSEINQIVDDMLPAGKADEERYNVEDVIKDRVSAIGARSERKYLSTQFHKKTYLVYAMVPDTDILYVSTNSQLAAPVFDQLQTGRILLAPANKISGFAPDKGGFSTERAASIAEAKRTYFGRPVPRDPFYYIVSGVLMIGAFGGYMVWSAIRKRRPQQGYLPPAPKRQLKTPPPAMAKPKQRRITPPGNLAPSASSTRYPNPGQPSVPSPRPAKPQNGFLGGLGRKPRPPKEPTPNPNPESGHSPEEVRKMEQELADYKKLLKKAGDKIEEVQQNRNELKQLAENKGTNSGIDNPLPFKPLGSAPSMPEGRRKKPSPKVRKQEEIKKKESPFRDGPPMGRKSPPPQDAGTGSKPSLEEENKALKQRIAELEQQQAKQAGGNKDKQEESPGTPKTSQRRNSPFRNAASPEITLVTLFTQWCNNQDAIIGKRKAFERMIHDNLDPRIKVTAVYKDNAASGVEVTFFNMDYNLRSPAEYWRVELGASQNQFIFPKPVDPSCFRDLTHVFAGNATPRELRGIRPAKISATGNSYTLIAPGQLH